MIYLHEMFISLENTEDWSKKFIGVVYSEKSSVWIFPQCFPLSDVSIKSGPRFVINKKAEHIPIEIVKHDLCVCISDGILLSIIMSFEQEQLAVFEYIGDNTFFIEPLSLDCEGNSVFGSMEVSSPETLYFSSKTSGFENFDFEIDGDSRSHSFDAMGSFQVSVFEYDVNFVLNSYTWVHNFSECTNLLSNYVTIPSSIVQDTVLKYFDIVLLIFINTGVTYECRLGCEMDDKFIELDWNEYSKLSNVPVCKDVTFTFDPHVECLFAEVTVFSIQ